MLVSLWLDKAYFLALFHLNWSLFWLHFRIYQTEMVFQIVSYQLVGKRCVKSWTSLKNTSFNTFWVRIGLNISNELTWLLFQHANENVSTVWSSELDTLLMRYGVKFTSYRIKSVSNSLDQTVYTKLLYALDRNLWNDWQKSSVHLRSYSKSQPEKRWNF